MDDRKTKLERRLAAKNQDLADAVERLTRSISSTSINICLGGLRQAQRAVEQLQRELLDESDAYT